MHSTALGFALLIALVPVTSARPNAIPAATPTATGRAANTGTPACAAGNVAPTQTIVRSTTETSVSRLLWIAATVVTMVTTQTETTLLPDGAACTGVAGPSDGGGEVVETVIGRTTYEYRLGYSDGHSSTSWAWETHTYTSTVTA